MDQIFQIGDFTFRMRYPKEVSPPPNFLLFTQIRHSDFIHAGEAYGKDDISVPEPEYTYEIRVSDVLPQLTGKVIARRPDLVVFQETDGTERESGADEAVKSGSDGKPKDSAAEASKTGCEGDPERSAGGHPALESRLIGVKGTEGYYACYRETGPDRAEVVLARDRIEGLHIDPVFTSLLALERRMIRRDSLVLHCAYVLDHGEAILFSAPSETGKTTQANLWEKYRGSRTVNGDRALLGKIDGCWHAQGWPVCGTSEVCSNEAHPIRAIVMLSQAKENRAERLTPGQAFPLLYSQITINRWNMEDHIRAMDLMEKLLAELPVYHLGCTISREAVTCLENALQEK